MPERKTLERLKQDRQEGKSPSTQAGEFIREEMKHIRKGKHGARSTRQAIAIGLSKARRAGVRLAVPSAGTIPARRRRRARRDLIAGQHPKRNVSRKRSRAITAALLREGSGAASKRALAAQAKSAARKRGPAARSAAARRAAETKGPAARSMAARKAARTRARRK